MSIADAEYPLGRRIAVHGKGGKTTLSKALAKKFGLVLIEQDAIRHQANWVERSYEDHKVVLEEMMESAAHGWVSDGNYRAVRDEVYSRVETIIVLALPLRVMMWRTFKRTLRRAITREELWNGNRENPIEGFFSPNGVVWDIWTRRELFRNVGESSIANAPEDARVIVLKSGKELNDFYSKYGLVRE